MVVINVYDNVYISNEMSVGAIYAQDVSLNDEDMEDLIQRVKKTHILAKCEESSPTPKAFVIWNPNLKRCVCLTSILICKLSGKTCPETTLHHIFTVIKSMNDQNNGVTAYDIRQVYRLCGREIYVDLQKRPNKTHDPWNLLSTYASTMFTDPLENEWKTAENYIQAHKCVIGGKQFNKFKMAKTAGDARNMGQYLKFPPHINGIQVIKDCFKLKYDQNGLARYQLMETGNLNIIDKQDPENVLGKILMETRTYYRQNENKKQKFSM